MASTAPGEHLYYDGIGNPPVRVEVRSVGEHKLGVFFRGRGDYDLVEEISGQLVPRADDEKAWESAGD